MPRPEYDPLEHNVYDDFDIDEFADRDLLPDDELIEPLDEPFNVDETE